jgi:hypothetical protein
MELLWSLGLIVVILLALNHMAGGRASTVLRPTAGLVTNIFSSVLRLVMGLLGGVLKIGAGKIGSLPNKDDKDSGRGPGPPPPRWD